MHSWIANPGIWVCPPHTKGQGSDFFVIIADCHFNNGDGVGGECWRRAMELLFTTEGGRHMFNTCVCVGGGESTSYVAESDWRCRSDLLATDWKQAATKHSLKRPGKPLRSYYMMKQMQSTMNLWCRAGCSQRLITPDKEVVFWI